MENTPVQIKIKKVVAQYKGLFPNEYKAAAEIVKESRLKSKSTRQLAKEAEGGNVSFERPLHQVPETLFNLIYTRLGEDEFMYYHSKEGAKWFMKEYPEFAVTEY